MCVCEIWANEGIWRNAPDCLLSFSVFQFLMALTWTYMQCDLSSWEINFRPSRCSSLSSAIQEMLEFFVVCDFSRVSRLNEWLLFVKRTVKNVLKRNFLVARQIEMWIFSSYILSRFSKKYVSTQKDVKNYQEKFDFCFNEKKWENLILARDIFSVYMKAICLWDRLVRDSVENYKISPIIA